MEESKTQLCISCGRFNKKGKIGLISVLIFATIILGTLSFYSINALAKLSFFGTKEVAVASFDCGQHIGNYSGCLAASESCSWGNNSGAIAQDPFCMIKYENFNSTSSAMWLSGRGNMSYSNITGGDLINSGCCFFTNAFGGGGEGAAQNCWNFDGNYSGCSNSTQYGVTGCTWKANSANQNPMCYVKKVGDWANGKSVNYQIDVGCCEKQGCWSFAGQNSSNCTSAFGGGVCNWDSSSFCPNSGGCCMTKSCSEATTQTGCEKLAQLDMPCVWNQSGSNACRTQGGGFNFYNSTDSCITKGGWWNSSGSCVMPGTSGGGGGSGGGGFMFAQEARCWFADQRQSVCQNITGCAYCTNTTTQLNNASSACYNMQNGMCQGHDPFRTSNWNGSTSLNITDVNQTSMVCGDVKLKQTCLCGPLPNCIWSNGSATTGSFCEAGLKTSDQAQTCTPPAKFCEDPLAKNNQTMCNDLATNYMMPCKWDNSSTAKNCTFNSIAVFGSGSSSGPFDFNFIGSETSCVAASGTWKEEYYVDSDGSFKQDAWCEKGAMFDFSTGMAAGNKGSCDSDCWACEFNASGSNYGKSENATLALISAQQTCLNSKKGVCVWKNDTNAPNQLGWCDYPREFEFGGVKDCNSDCKACEFFASPQTACWGSTAGCSWVNESTSPKGGFCQSSSKKSCSSECFSCYSPTECSNSTYHSAMNCSWESALKLCKPSGFTGEICFNALDDDNDGKADCADSDCTYDQFCGGGGMGGGSSATDCKKKFSQNECANTRSASGINCTWVAPEWGGSYCDYPGADCWRYDNNLTGCKKSERGCIYRNASGGYPEGASVRIDAKAFNGFCEMNKTQSAVCYNTTNAGNNILCSASSECFWITDNYNSNGGRCEFKPFALCGNNTNAASCNGVSDWCTWRNNTFSSSGGFCEPKCAGLTSGNCNGFCQWKSNICEAEAFGGMEIGGVGAGGTGGGFGCHSYDGNYTSCLSQNMTCSWKNFTLGSAAMGVCNEKGAQMMFESMDQSPPKILGQDSSDVSPSEIDIREHGIKDMASSLAFGIVVNNITNASVCKGYYLGGAGGAPVQGSGNAPTKFYWFLDTNKNTTDGCNATTQAGINITGYEFLIKYLISVNNGTVTETKTFNKCTSGSWGLTNVPLTSNRQFMCGMSTPFAIGGVMIIVDKEKLESFTEYNKTAPMRVFVSSGHNDSYHENNPKDSVGSPGYYTHGSADFKFVNCMDPSTKDEKCKSFNKFGFNVFEDCKNGKDDDSDGQADCADKKCAFMPMCAGGTGFNFIADVNDNEAPSVVFSNVDALHDGAFIKFDSTEPANGTLSFYANDSQCQTLNKTLNEVGDSSISFDDYKPFHLVPLDQNTLPGYTNGLSNDTTYFYKTKICDPSNNCAESACLNLTTKSLSNYKNFVFKMKLPAGFNVTIPALNYSGNFTKLVGSSVYEAGIKTNASVTRNINVSINCGNQSLTFVGVDIFKPKSIDMSGAFICNPGNATLGMNSTSKAWDQVVSDLGMGGSGDHIKLTFPIDYGANNNITWCKDDGTNCTSVNSYANCSSGGTSKTDCKIPTSLGFSTYTLASPGSTSSPAGESPASSSGGGGGGSSTTTKKNTTANVTTGSTAITPSEEEKEEKAGEEKGEATTSEEESAGTGGEKGSQWILWIVLVIVIAVIVSVLLIRSSNKKKRGY